MSYHSIHLMKIWVVWLSFFFLFPFPFTIIYFAITGPSHPYPPTPCHPTIAIFPCIHPEFMSVCLNRSHYNRQKERGKKLKKERSRENVEEERNIERAKRITIGYQYNRKTLYLFHVTNSISALCEPSPPFFSVLHSFTDLKIIPFAICYGCTMHHGSRQDSNHNALWRIHRLFYSRRLGRQRQTSTAEPPSNIRCHAS